MLNRASARGRELLTEGLAAEGLRMGHHALLAALADLADLADLANLVEHVEAPVAQADLVRLTGFDPKDVVVC
jgi:MarR family transcriptional regulator, lower aerobic nicotinate degradation pathway regulator